MTSTVIQPQLSFGNWRTLQADIDHWEWEDGLCFIWSKAEDQAHSAQSVTYIAAQQLFGEVHQWWLDNEGYDEPHREAPELHVVGHTTGQTKVPGLLPFMYDVTSYSVYATLYSEDSAMLFKLRFG